MSRRRPIILGIVGDSAAGKTTLISGLIDIIGRDRVTHVCTDDYHRYDRKERAALGITALHPDCNYIDVMEMHLEQLHYGQPILKPVYDHSTGTLVRPEYVVPREFVIVEGLLGFFSPVLRQFLDVKVFLDPPETLRREWKLKRDTTKRGYTAEQVLAELEKREADSRDYIRTQRDFADIVVRFYPPEDIVSELNVRLVLRPTIAHPDLTYLVDETHSPDCGIRLELGRDRGRPADFLEITGDVATSHAEELEQAIWRHLPGVQSRPNERVGAYQDRAATRRSNQLALTQLLLSYHLLRNYNDLDNLPFASPVAALSRVASTPTAAAAAAAASS